MIATLAGVLKSVGKDSIVLEIGGIGFSLSLPQSALHLLPEAGAPLFLHTTLIIRELAWNLYGFLTEEEKKLFDLLLNVNGVGPKLALSILGSLGTNEILDALNRGDHAALARIPGIGKKTAERLCLDLRGKIAAQGKEITSLRGKFVDNKSKDAMQALLHLGYSQAAAEKAVKKTIEELGGDLDIGILIKAALSQAR